MNKTAATILVVDDLEANRFIVSFLLEDMGFTVLQASDGAQAVEMAAKESVDLILMDCQMPVMDGFEATSQIRASQMETPIIAYSAGHNKDACLSVGMNDYLCKPAMPESIQETVEFWLNKAA